MKRYIPILAIGSILLIAGSLLITQHYSLSKDISPDIISSQAEQTPLNHGPEASSPDSSPKREEELKRQSQALEKELERVLELNGQTS